MTYVTVIVVACLFFAVVTVWHRRYGGYLPEPYRSRPCQGFAWRRAFPDSSKDEIKDFLRLFGGAFAYREAQKLQVAPEDNVLAVYRAEYPRVGGIDGCELEMFAASVEKAYKIDFVEIWSEAATFGTLFAACQAASGSRRELH